MKHSNLWMPGYEARRFTLGRRVPRQFKHQIVALANGNRESITEDFSSVRAIVDGSPLVFGVFQDAAEPDGVGMLLVKGHALLREIVASGKAFPVDMTAIPCTCAEQAEALRLVAGESDKMH